MKTVLKALPLVCIIVLAAWLPVYATTPTEVSGYFDYWPVEDPPPIVENRGGNLFVWAADTEVWWGDLDGTATSEYLVIFHRSGVATFSSKGQFVGSVLDSESGTLEYQLTGIWQAGADEWQGTWWMGNGTGGLENAHAEGTWGGPGYSSPDPPSPMCSYQGLVHFDP